MHNKILIKIIAAMAIGCLSVNISLFVLLKNQYQNLINMQLLQISQQQHYLLQRLGKNLLQNTADVESIRLNIRAYEDVLFALSKQNLAIPMSVYFVSFTAPQQVIGSNGSLDAKTLAPEDAYYLRAMDTPGHLVFSKPYIKPEMPEFWLANLGIGLLKNEIYYGQLDAKVALQTLHDYVLNGLPIKSRLFNFKLGESDVMQPKISVNWAYAFVKLGWWFVWEIVALASLVLILLRISKLFKEHLSQKLAFTTLAHNLQELKMQNSLECKAREVQHIYGTMNYHDTQIALSQLLSDIEIVNAPLARLRSVHLNLQPKYISNLKFSGDRLHLMQILASILHEIILQLMPGSSISLQVLITDLQQGMQLLQFKFPDDGFYNALNDRQQPVSNADICSQGWNNIYDLIEEAEGTVEHQHTPYAGNTLTFTIVRRMAAKVISIEKYYSQT